MVVVCVALAPAEARAQGRGTPAFSDEAVERAIDKAKAYLWSLYLPRKGHWPVRENYEGGHTALASLALLSAGQSYQDARMEKALRWLAGVETDRTYVLGLRAQVWSKLPHKDGRRLLAKDARQLIDSICRPKAPPVSLRRNPSYGSYGYGSPGKITGGGDHSNTQFGILGVWAAASRNLEVPSWYWQLVYRHFDKVQNPDGGWGYGGHRYGGNPVGSPSKATMTAAGLASTFVAIDNIDTSKFTKCGQNPLVRPIERGLAWTEKNYRPGVTGYLAYAVERVGLASGYKYFGNKDWYKLGAMNLVRRQQADGSIGDLVNTSFNLLFLVRGRAPVLFNRLEYAGDWNNRPRALANLTRWTSRKFEREVNWQIINLKVPVEEWHDAPILMISGSKAPTLTGEELAKLRRYVHQGGMLFTATECKGRPFDRAWRDQLYPGLFPGYELKELPPDHPIYTAHFRIRRPVRLWAVYNGIRILALHAFDDLPVHWQTNSYATQTGVFELAFNVVYYTTDHASLRHRGTSPWPADRPIVPLRRVKVARVKYAGNWDPEPLAWRRFAMLMGQNWQTRVETETVTADKLDPAAFRVAAMTGTTAVTLSQAEKKGLKAFVDGGGTLILDAGGGSAAFADSAAGLLEALFGAGSLRRLSSFEGVYRLPGMEIEKVGYRRAARRALGRSRTPRLMGVKIRGRVAAFLSREDLTSGLVGYPCYTCIGYAPGTLRKPGSAIRLMRNMVLYGNRVRKPVRAAAAAG
jgi:hypothetical protein